MNLFVGNLSPETTEKNLADAFSEFGKINSVKIIIDSATGLPKGFGFVEMDEKFHAYDAIDNLDATYFHGTIISVKEAKGNKTNNRAGGGSKPFQKRAGGFNSNRSGSGGFNSSRSTGSGYGGNRSTGSSYGANRSSSSGSSYNPNRVGSSSYDPNRIDIKPSNDDTDINYNQ